MIVINEQYFICHLIVILVDLAGGVLAYKDNFTANQHIASNEPNFFKLATRVSD